MDARVCERGRKWQQKRMKESRKWYYWSSSSLALECIAVTCMNLLRNYGRGKHCGGQCLITLQTSYRVSKIVTKADPRSKIKMMTKMSRVRCQATSICYSSAAPGHDIPD